MVRGKPFYKPAHTLDRFKTYEEADRYLKQYRYIPDSYEGVWIEGPKGALLAFYAIGRRGR